MEVAREYEESIGEKSEIRAHADIQTHIQRETRDRIRDRDVRRFG